MSNINTAFCNAGLSFMRAEAKRLGIKIPKLTTWSTNQGNSRYYEVWNDSEIVWSGTAYSASEAKSNYITNLIDEVQS